MFGDVDREETIVSVGAWVLMPNHFHIYITSPKDGLWEKIISVFSCGNFVLLIQNI